MNSKHEDVGFSFSLPNGRPLYTFIHFISPVEIELENKVIKAIPNSFIIFSPDYPIKYRTTSQKLNNNFFLFDISNTSDKLAFNNIPLNTLCYTSRGDEITRRIEIISYNFSHSKNTINISDRIEELFELLKDECATKANNHSQVFYKYNNFLQIREDMKKNPAEWNVQKMAKRLGYSRSYFSLKYKEYFNISASEDLCNAKLTLATQLLTSTSKTVEEISFGCGYTNVSFFIEKFKIAYGYTPLKYRKMFTSKSKI